MLTTYIAMGGNMTSWAGGPEETLAAAALRLESAGRVVSRSSLYSTAPVGYDAQPRFLNAVVALETELEPRALLERLQAIEREFGRDRSAGVRNGPRTLDLDILLFGNLEISEPTGEKAIEIPHPRLAERAFVLVPLNEIAAEVVVPGRGETVGQLLASLFAQLQIVVPEGAGGFISLKTSANFSAFRHAIAPSEAQAKSEAVFRVESEDWRSR